MTYNNQVTESVKKLYDTVPYAAYGEDYFPVFKSLGLSREAFKSAFANKQALEVGCGGGQLTAFMANNFQHVTGVDISQKSLDYAKKICSERGLNNVDFLEGNLFDDLFLNSHTGQYNFILCYGVLHHTADPRQGFERLCALLKPGGILLVGVYSRTMLTYRLKRKLILLLAGEDWGKREFWAKRLFFKNSSRLLSIYDGFVHPQVSFHSIRQVYNWLQENSLQYLGSWPSIELSWYINRFLGKAEKPASSKVRVRPRWFLAVELLWIISGKQVMVSVAAKKPERPL
jgi:SAM-dependent methyltransferase